MVKRRISPAGVSWSRRMGFPRNAGPSRRAVASLARRAARGDDEDAAEGKQRGAIGLRRIGGGDARRVGGEKAVALSAGEPVEIGPETGAAGPFGDPVAARQAMQVLGL